MVEGPGCKVKGERLLPRIRGKTVTGVKGNCVDRDKKKSKVWNPNDSPYYSLIGQKVEDVKTLGKELFIFFQRYSQCLRVHFLMAGSFRVNDKEVDPDGSRNVNTEKPAFELHLGKDKASFYKSAVDLRSAADSQQKIVDLLDVDICSATFSQRRATELMQRDGTRQVCDVLLDQLVLPGVGNIIKNEGLFDSGIHPNTKISDLTGSHISLLVKMTRDFSMIFYKCRRDGKPLQPYYKIYRKGSCKLCKGKCVTTRMGEDNGRLTSFCPACQDNDLARAQARHLPAKNSLLGWVTSAKSGEPEEWKCSQCTLINAGTRLNCEACLHPKKTVEKTLMCTLERKNNESIKTVNNPNKRKCKAELMSLPKKPKSESSVNQPEPSDEGKANLSIKDPPMKSAKPVPPNCTGHNKRCTIREVRKSGENKGRLFYACTLQKEKNCNFFAWADEHFPFCEHAKRCLQRTVLKQGANNGRPFYCCSQPKNKQCRFFQWADGAVQGAHCGSS